MSDPINPQNLVSTAPTVAQEAEQAVIDTLTRRGYMQTETWVLAVGSLLTVVLAKVGVSGNDAVQVIAVVAPLVVSLAFAGMRLLQKKFLAATSPRF